MTECYVTSFSTHIQCMALSGAFSITMVPRCNMQHPGAGAQH